MGETGLLDNDLQLSKVSPDFYIKKFVSVYCKIHGILNDGT